MRQHLISNMLIPLGAASRRKVQWSSVLFWRRLHIIIICFSFTRSPQSVYVRILTKILFLVYHILLFTGSNKVLSHPSRIGECIDVVYYMLVLYYTATLSTCLFKYDAPANKQLWRGLTVVNVVTARRLYLAFAYFLDLGAMREIKSKLPEEAHGKVVITVSQLTTVSLAWQFGATVAQIINC